MGSIHHKIAEAGHADMRLDKWFQQQYPGLGFGHLQKLLRTGQVRVNGKRVKTSARLQPGDDIRIPPFEQRPPREKTSPVGMLSKEEIAEAKSWVLWEDDHIIVINKPAGLSTQGGSKTYNHVDRMMAAFSPKPKLVHRLDRDTSGVLILAKTGQVAKELMHMFQQKTIEKVYWALTEGVPTPQQGLIKRPLNKLMVGGQEKVVVDENKGKRAHTLYRVIDHAARELAWVEARPLTGRTHQIRVHMQSLETPIMGDGKYGAKDPDAPLYLHARLVQFELLGLEYQIWAPLPEHFLEAFEQYDFDEEVGQALAEEGIIEE